jgi:hypothetical protein
MKTALNLQGSTCWVIGRRVRIASNEYEYVGQPFIVFPTEEAARAAAKMIEDVSGESVMVVEAALYQEPKAGQEDGK